MPRLQTAIDKLIPPELLQLQQVDLLFRARALVGGLLLIGSIVLLVLLLLAWQFGIDKNGVPAMVVSPMVIVMVTGGISLWLFRYYATFMLSTHLFTLMHTAIQVWLILATGGVRASPLAGILALQPILAFMMAGRWAGLMWVVIVIGLGILLTPLDSPALVPQLPEGPREFLRQIIWIILCAGFFGCFWYFDQMNRRLMSNIGRERDVAQFAAAHDPLTGLLNRGAFVQRLEAGVQRAQFSAQPLALIYVDLDGFKGINDNLGHHAGDHLLNELAQRLRHAVRSSDSVARLGGDEFGLLLEGATRKTLERLLPTMLASIAAPITFENLEISISASIGIALLPSDAGDPELLSRCADHAMYRAKLRGRNQFAFFGDL